MSNATQEWQMLRRILQGGSVVIVILGGDHDLRDAIKAACPRRLVTVLTPEKFAKMNAMGR